MNVISAPEEIVILHLSDLHIANDKSIGAQRIESLAGAVGAHANESTHLVIVFSGDIAYSGISREYGSATQSIERLLVKLQEWKFSSVRMYSVPGNHDCDFSLMDAGVHEALLSGVNGDATRISGVVKALSGIQKEFEIFRGVVCAPSQSINEVLSFASVDLGGRTLNLALLNTSWSSRLHEKPGVLRMPAEILPEIAHTDDFTIGVLHHPLNWYAPQDGKVLSEWLDLNVDMALWGHEHRADEFQIIRNRFGSSVRHVLAIPVEDKSAVCGFRITTWSVEDTLIVHDYEWKNERITKVGKDVYPRPVNPARSLGQIRFKPAFKEFLNDTGASFKHPRVSRPIVLDDILVPPEFKSFDLTKNDIDRVDESLSLSEFADSLYENEKTIVFGQEQSGKSTLAKIAIEDARHRGITPIYLDVSRLTSAGRGEVSGWIKSSIANQYNADCIELIEYLEPSKKIVIVDNLNSRAGGGAGADLIIERVSSLASRALIFTSQNPAITILASNYESVDDSAWWRGGRWLELLPLGSKKRGELIRRWATIGRDQQIDAGIVEAEVRQIKRILDAALGKNFIPKYPIFILILLQQVEALTESKTLVSNGSHGYLFESLITTALNEFVRAHPISTVHDFLARLSFELWTNSDQEISESEYAALIRKFKSDRLVDIAHPVLLNELINARVLKLESGLIQFRYPYLKYYYLAGWLSANSGEDAGSELLDEVVSYIHTEQSSNVLMFLSHLGQEKWVLDLLLPMTKELFANEMPCVLSDRANLANKFSDLKSREVLLLGEPSKISDHVHAQEDDDQLTQEELAEEVEDAFKFNTAMRVIQTLGHILRSRAGNVSADTKVEVASESIKMARRLMTSLYDVAETSAETLVRHASEVFEKKLKFDQNAAIGVANRMVGVVVSGISKSLVSKTADSFATSELLPLVEVLEKSAQDRNDIDDRLFLLVARMVADKEFPMSLVDDFLRDAKKGDVLSRSTLAWAAARRFYVDPPQHAMRDRACAKLGIEVRKLPHKTPAKQN